MGSPNCSWGNVKRDLEDNLDVKTDRAGDGEERECVDKRRHRSSKSRKPSSGDDDEGLEINWKRKGSGEKSGSRKRSGGQEESDDDDYESRQDSRAKQAKKKHEESSLEKLSNWYEDGDLESRPNGGDKLDSKGNGLAEKSEKRKSTLKSDQEGLRTGSKGREGRSGDGDVERTQERDSRYSERWDSSRDKGHGSSDQARNSRRRWDESDSVRKAEEGHYEIADVRKMRDSDYKYEGVKERNASPVDCRNKGSESNSQKVNKITKEKKADAERIKSTGRSEAVEEGRRDSPNIREVRSTRENSEKHRHQRTPGSRDIADSQGKSFSSDESGITWNRERSLREVGGQGDRSGPPEMIVMHQQDVENSEIEFDKGSDLKSKELDKEVCRDDRQNIKDDSLSERSREREGYRENWKRRQRGSNDNDFKDVDIACDHGREWEVQRHGRERIESERHHGRIGHRKDANRGEAVKTSSNYASENYDVIEIQTRPFDHGRAGSASNLSRRSECSQQYDVKSQPNDNEWAYAREDRVRRADASGDELKDREIGDSTPPRDPSKMRGGKDFQGGKGIVQKGVVASHSAGGQTLSGSQLPYGNQDPGSLVRTSQGVKGSRGGRGGRLRPIGRDNQQAGFPFPMMGSPFGPMGILPPGPMQPLNHNLTPAPGPPISPGVFIPPFSPPVVWPGDRGVDMNMLSVPLGLSPVPPGASGPRFPANVGTPPNPSLYLNQSGPGRGTSPNPAASNFSALGPTGRGTPHDKASGGWAPRSSGSSGKAPSRGEQNDYSQNFVDTGSRPQNFIRELELTNVEDYPKLRELIQKKDEIVANSASPPMYFKSDLKEFELSPEFFGTKFDVILVDPPWEEYVHRAPGVADHMDYWTFEEIMNLKIEAIADTPSFIFLWVGDGVGLEQGRQCLKKWGFRRCEDICWVKTNKINATPGLRHDSHTLFQHTKEHCLMGIKGTVRRSTDGHIIHANIDTDVIIAEEPPYGSTRKPEDMYRIIEHFALGRRRLELFGEDHNIRAGWLTVGKGLSSSNFNPEGYTKSFADKDGKVWQGGGGRNPPPDAPHLVLTTPDIEALRPRSPMKNQQQLQQQQSNTISLTSGSSSNRRAAGTSPQNPPGFILNQESTGGFKGREGSNMPSEDKVFDMYGFGGQANVDVLDFESQRALSLL